MTSTLLFFLIIIAVVAVVIVLLAVFVYRKVNKAAEAHGTALVQIEDSLSRIQDMIQESGDAAEAAGFAAAMPASGVIEQAEPEELAADAGAVFRAEPDAVAAESAAAGEAAEPAPIYRADSIPASAAVEREDEIEAIWDSGKTVTESIVPDSEETGPERVARKNEPEIWTGGPEKTAAEEESVVVTVFPKFRNRDDGTDKFGRVYTLEELRAQIR